MLAEHPSGRPAAAPPERRQLALGRRGLAAPAAAGAAALLLPEASAPTTQQKGVLVTPPAPRVVAVLGLCYVAMVVQAAAEAAAAEAAAAPLGPRRWRRRRAGTAGAPGLTCSYNQHALSLKLAGAVALFAADGDRVLQSGNARAGGNELERGKHRVIDSGQPSSRACLASLEQSGRAWGLQGSHEPTLQLPHLQEVCSHAFRAMDSLPQPHVNSEQHAKAPTLKEGHDSQTRLLSTQLAQLPCPAPHWACLPSLADLAGGQPWLQ